MDETELISADWVVPVETEPIRNGAVLIRGDRIAAVGPRTELEALEDAKEAARHEYAGAVLIPGFVNAHAHLEYACFAGFGDGLEFGPWIDLHVARKRRLSPPELLASARLGAASCLASGITTVADASFSGMSAAACAELGLRAIIHIEVFGSAPDGAAARFDELRRPFEEHASSLLTLGVSPHAPYSASASVFRWARDLDMPIATHLAESQHEQEFMVSSSGPIERLAAMVNVDSPKTTSVRHLHEGDALNPRVVAAHCVTVDEEEIGLLAATDTAVAHCPRSNVQLGCGIAPVSELLAAGIRVGLGTDSPASAPNFDMFEEMRAAIAGTRSLTASATALSASDALRLATLDSARALGLADEIGSLSTGKHADLTVVSTADSLYDPIEQPEEAVVYGGSPQHILRTITEGTTRYDRGGFEWHELREAAKAARARMLEASVTAAT